MSNRTDQVHELVNSLRRATALTVSMSQAAAAKIGINTTDLHCLNLLSQTGPMTAGELARLTGLTTASITSVIDRLERAGYVHRERDTHDRRRVVIDLLMDRAAPAVAPVFRSLIQDMHQLLEGYDEDELALVAGFLQRTEQVFRANVERMRVG